MSRLATRSTLRGTCGHSTPIRYGRRIHWKACHAISFELYLTGRAMEKGPPGEQIDVGRAEQHGSCWAALAVAPADGHDRHQAAERGTCCGCECRDTVLTSRLYVRASRGVRDSGGAKHRQTSAASAPTSCEHEGDRCGWTDCWMGASSVRAVACGNLDNRATVLGLGLHRTEQSNLDTKPGLLTQTGRTPGSWAPTAGQAAGFGLVRESLCH